MLVPTALAALADDTRIGIVEALSVGERNVGDLVSLFDVSQPAISRHLRVLRDAGVVTVRPDGKQRWYRLTASSLREVSTWADSLARAWEARFDALDEHLDRMAASEETE